VFASAGERYAAENLCIGRLGSWQPRQPGVDSFPPARCAFLIRTLVRLSGGGSTADHCAFCGGTDGPFTRIEGLFTVLMWALLHLAISAFDSLHWDA
jgi:hypothetical protein